MSLGDTTALIAWFVGGLAFWYCFGNLYITEWHSIFDLGNHGPKAEEWNARDPERWMRYHDRTLTGIFVLVLFSGLVAALVYLGGPVEGAWSNVTAFVVGEVVSHVYLGQRY